MEVKFSENFLHWESSDNFDPHWEVEDLHKNSNVTHGFYDRANSSTGFEDTEERVVDLNDFNHRPELLSTIETCTQTYNSILYLGKL